MRADGIPQKLLNLIIALYSCTRSSVRVYGRLTESFSVRTGVRQGAITSPTIFNYAVDWVLVMAVRACEEENLQVGFTCNGKKITDFDYADDIGLGAESGEALNRFVYHVSFYGSLVGLQISVPKSKVISCCMPPPCKMAAL